MKKSIVFLLVIFFVKSELFSNFTGFERSKLGAFSESLNILKNSKIRFSKERLYFKLGQNVQFCGKYWFTNEANNEQKVIWGFPQESYWEAAYNEINGKYIPGEYYKFNPIIRINGNLLNKLDEKYSPREIDFSKEVEFKSVAEMKRLVTEYAGSHEAEGKAKMPILIWKLFECTIPASSDLLIDVEFTMPWFYQDELWSDNIYTNGIRSFSYITSNARNWAGGVIKDFEAIAEYPTEAGAYLQLAPAEWSELRPGEAILKLANYKPRAESDIYLTWKSDYLLEIDDEVKGINLLNLNREQETKHKKIISSCWKSLYYKDYNWRFLFDHCAETSWAFDLTGLECPKFSILPINNRSLNSKKLQGEMNGPEISPKTSESTKAIFKRIKIVSGQATNEKSFFSHNRPREIEFYFKNGLVEWSQLVFLQDTPQPQFFNIMKPGIIPHAFKIKNIYKSPNSREIFFAELSFIE